MSELRAPDPTLTALDGEEELSIQERGDGGCDIAHRYLEHDEPEGWRGPMWWTIDASRARWFAVPCRECFPDAPPAGCPPSCMAGLGCDYVHEGLTWQVQP